jgi:hypothetical protein
MNDLVVSQKLPFNTSEACANSIGLIDEAIKQLREYKKSIEDEFINILKDTDSRSIVIGEYKYWVGTKTTERYNSVDIIALIKAGNGQAVKCLPLNPAWKKTEVLKLQEQEKKEYNWQELEDKLEIKAVPTKILEALK